MRASHAHAAVVVEERRDFEEPGHESIGGLRVHLLRRTALMDATGAHHGDSIAESERLVAIVSDEDRRRVGRAQDLGDLVTEFLAQDLVETGERLVEQHHRRSGSESARQRHPLLFATRELMRITTAESGEFDEFEHLVDASATRGSIEMTEAEGDVPIHS